MSKKGVFILLGFFIISCRTVKKDSSISGNKGFFDKNWETSLAIPKDLPEITTSGSTTTTSSVQGLGLTSTQDTGTSSTSVQQNNVPPPVSSADGATILLQCFTNDTDFKGKNWKFYSALKSNGSVVRSMSYPLENCGEIRLALGTLDKNLTYMVEALIYYPLDESGKSMIWYKGQTREFKPTDQDVGLVLEKLVQDQVVDVSIAASGKEACLAQNFFWNGTSCINHPVLLALHDSQPDKTISAEEQIQKPLCLGSRDDGFIETQDCAGGNRQTLVFSYHTASSADKLPQKELGWFTVKFPNNTSSAREECLTYVPTNKTDDKGDIIRISRSVCTEIDYDGVRSPVTSQLFTLIPSLPGDNGGRDTFKLVSAITPENDALCLSIAPSAGIIATPKDAHNLARFLPCDGSAPAIKATQFLEILDSDL